MVYSTDVFLVPSKWAHACLRVNILGVDIRNFEQLFLELNIQFPISEFINSKFRISYV